jgi:glycosyltransferase involved in cell wall biosynthesis
MKKVLITVPHKRTKGGINSFFAAVEPYYHSEIRYITRGSSSYPYHSNIINQLIRLFIDFCNFFLVILFHKFNIIHINLTIDKRGLSRDLIYVMLSSMKSNSKLLVFIHGWDQDYVNSFSQEKSRLIMRIFSRADAIIVLSNEFRLQFEKWGCKKPVYVLTTAVDLSLVSNLSLQDIMNKNQQHKFVVLFLARLEKEKGIHIALDVFKMLNNRFPEFHFIVAGDGSELESVKYRVISENIQNVSILGHISGEKKRNCFLNSDVYFFPTYYKEGLPTSVLEAFCFGLPVVTRPVAGIRDVFENEKSGLIIDSLDPEQFVMAITRIFEDDIMRKEIIAYNFEKGRKEYTGDIIAEKLERIYSSLYA